MIRHLLLGIVMLGLLFGCSSKKEDAGSSAALTQDANTIEEKPLSFDVMGSDSGNIPGLFTVNFEYDQATLTAEARDLLVKNAEWIKANTQYNIQIEGHCDDRGSNEYNLALGERRAKTAKSYLEKMGISGKRMSIISYGEEKPLAQGDTEAIWAKNRRANFVPTQK